MSFYLPLLSFAGMCPRASHTHTLGITIPAEVTTRLTLDEAVEVADDDGGASSACALW